MQKFNLGEIVKTKKTGMRLPGFIVEISGPTFFYQMKKNMHTFVSWSKHFDEDLLAKSPIYSICSFGPVRPQSFLEFLESTGINNDINARKVYEATTGKVQYFHATEPDLELVALNMEEWANSFENKEEFDKYVEDLYPQT